MIGKIKILVATMGGTAELVADEIAGHLEDNDHSVSILRMEKVSPSALAAGGVFIICTSTYGTGELPDNGKPLFDALKAERPDLSAMQYGVFGLGDSVYPNTFCFGGKLFDELLGELGARRIGDIRQHDRSGKEYPEDAAVEWIEEWIGRAEEAAA